MAIEWLLDGRNLILLLFSIGAVSSALLTVLASNPLRSAIFLVVNLFCVAGIYLALNAFFLSVVQVIVYAGAIMVLFLFVIMLLNLDTPERQRDPMRLQLPIAVLVGGSVASFLTLVFVRSTRGLETLAPGGFSGTVAGVGKELYAPSKPWLFPFELTSVLLLIAVIGAVVLARRSGETAQ